MARKLEPPLAEHGKVDYRLTSNYLSKALGAMCGIVVYVAPDSNAEPAFFLEEALDRLAHRGPDGATRASSGRTMVARTQLATVDIDCGLLSTKGKFLVACNGRIYNHQLLRERLASRHELRMRSDTEVIAHLYEELGAECAAKLDGPFAFFASDGANFVAARDPLGIKPLYVGRDRAQGIWFASEFKALPRYCDSFQALPAGSTMIEDGSIRRWYRPAWAEQIGVERSFSATELLSRLEKATIKRLTTDVPIGVFLSGGLDSSVIAALVRKHVDRLQTFAVGRADSPDLIAASAVARGLGTEHRERLISTREVTDELENVIYHLESYDPALVRNAVPTYLVSELASEHVNVVLTGEGADEIFAGYDYMGQVRSGAALHAECARLLLGLHAMNLQRVDRMTMAHALEGRVPFLDLEFVDWAMGFDPRLKLHGRGIPEKRLLRAAAEGLLTRDVLCRPKLDVSDGTGVSPILRDHAERRISDRDLRRAYKRFPEDTPSTKEELLYRNIFEELFPATSAQRAVAKWTPALQPPGLA